MRKFIIILSVLAISLSLLPLSAFAASAPVPTPDDFLGVEWWMDDELAYPSWTGSLETAYFDNFIRIYLYSRPGETQNFEFELSDLYFDDADGTLYGIYDAGRGELPIYNFNSGQWLVVFRYLMLDLSPTPISYELFQWFYQSGVPTCKFYNDSISATYPVTTFRVNMDDDTYSDIRFSANPFNQYSSAIALSVSSSDIIFSETNRIKSIDPGYSSNFLGFSTSVGGSLVYPLGSNVAPLSTSSNSLVELYPYYPSASTASTSIRFYNSTGDVLLYSNTFYGDELSPVIKLAWVQTDTIAIIRNIDNTILDTFIFDPVYGFANQPNSVYADFTRGGTVLVGGNELVSSRTFYAVDNAPPSSPLPGSEVTQWLGDMLSGFLGAEIFPGFSFSDLLVICIAIGLLFTFLKIAI